MPDLQPLTNSNGASTPPEPNDALAGLRKMSVTAGLGSGDYVAINTLAIASVLLGLGSMIVPLLGYDLLLIIPLAAIVTAVVAWRQIQLSNGTQTGKGLAAFGIALAVLIGGGDVAVKVVSAWRYAPQTREIAGIVEKLGSEIQLAGEAMPAAEPATRPVMGPTLKSAADMDRMIQMNRHYRNAYLLFSDRFRDRVSLDRFSETWSMVNRSGGGVKSMKWNGHIEYDTDTGSGSPEGFVMALLRMNNSREASREEMIFTKEAGKWEIDNIPALFEEARRRKKPQ